MKLLYSLTIMIILPFILSGQDPYFSQFYASRVYLNPAYAGFDPAGSVELSYRDQWFGVPDGDITTYEDSYRTYLISTGWQIPCIWELDELNFGVGLTAFQDEAGNSPLETTGFSFAFSNEVQLGNTLNRRKSKRNLQRLDLRAGAQISMMQKRLDGNYFIYSSQLDPVGGLNGNLPSSLDLRSNWFMNINAGIMLRGYIKKSKYNDQLFTIGMSFNNVNEPNESLQGGAGDFKLSARTTLHAGFTQKITQFKGTKQPIYLAPQFRWDRQASGNLNLYTLGAYILSKGVYTGLFIQGNTRHYSAPPPNAVLEGNFLSKNTTTMILNFGVDLKTALTRGQTWSRRPDGIILGLSYDVGLSGLSQENTLGVFELHLRVAVGKDKRRAPYCGAELGRFELYDGACPVRF
jgi:type IX secretion system PorP/SprF family membrane protein